MKKVLILLLFIPLVSFGQGDIGKSKSQILAKYSVAPCEKSGITLMFCSSDGNMIGYVFTNNNRAKSVKFYTAYSSRYKAEIELEKAINSFSQDMNDTPFRRNGMTVFSVNNKLGCTFSTIQYKGTYYVRQIYEAIY